MPKRFTLHARITAPAPASTTTAKAGCGGSKVACDLLVLWAERGVVNRLFDPMALWRPQYSERLTGHAVASGHFIPEEQPETTAKALLDFFR